MGVENEEGRGEGLGKGTAAEQQHDVTVRLWHTAVEIRGAKSSTRGNLKCRKCSHCERVRLHLGPLRHGP